MGEIKQKKTITTADKIKFAGLLIFFVLIIIASIFAVRFIQGFGGGDDAVASLVQAIKDAGVFGILICLGIQFIQVVVAFIPGEVVQVAIGYVYGTVWGGLLTLLGALIGSIFIFYLVRKLGAPFVQGMLGKKESGKTGFVQKLLEDSKRLNATIFILYLIPGLPKDVFNYLVPLTEMRPANFFVLSTIARAPAIFASTFVAHAFSQGNYLGMAIVAVIFGGLGIIGIVFNEKIMTLVDRLLARLSHKKA